MANQERKVPPALVVIDGELFHAFNRWRNLEGLALTEADIGDGWLLHLHRQPEAGDEEMHP